MNKRIQSPGIELKLNFEELERLTLLQSQYTVLPLVHDEWTIIPKAERFGRLTQNQPEWQHIRPKKDQ